MAKLPPHLEKRKRSSNFWKKKVPHIKRLLTKYFKGKLTIKWKKNPEGETDLGVVDLRKVNPTVKQTEKFIDDFRELDVGYEIMTEKSSRKGPIKVIALHIYATVTLEEMYER